MRIPQHLCTIAYYQDHSGTRTVSFTSAIPERTLSAHGEPRPVSLRLLCTFVIGSIHFDNILTLIIPVARRIRCQLADTYLKDTLWKPFNNLLSLHVYHSSATTFLTSNFLFAPCDRNLVFYISGSVAQSQNPFEQSILAVRFPCIHYFFSAVTSSISTRLLALRVWKALIQSFRTSPLQQWDYTTLDETSK